MTVPYISAPAWAPRRRRAVPVGPQPRAVAVAPDARPASLGALVGYGLRRIAWIDVAIQLIAGAAVIAIAWVLVTGGAFQRAVDTFSGWYLGAVAPVYSTGIAVVPADFREGFFGAPPEVPAALLRPGPGYTMVAEISGLVGTSGR